MRVVCLLIFLCGIVTINIKAKPLFKTAQENEDCSVTLRGQVESVEVTNVPPSSVSIVVKLKLKLLNNGEKPVIFLEEKTPLLVGYVLTKNPSKVFPENKLVFSFTGPSVDTSPEWAVLRKRLDQSFPPPDTVRILMPHETWVFDDSVRVFLSTEAGNKSTFLKNASWETVQELSPVWLRVIYQVWPMNLEPLNNDRTKMTFGYRLQKQWKDFGYLWLNDLYSEPFTLNLSTTFKR